MTILHLHSHVLYILFIGIRTDLRILLYLDTHVTFKMY